MNLKQKLRKLLVAGEHNKLTRLLKQFDEDNDITTAQTGQSVLAEFDGTEFGLSPSCLLTLLEHPNRLKVCSLTPREQMYREEDKMFLEHVDAAVKSMEDEAPVPFTKEVVQECQEMFDKTDALGRTWEHNPSPERIAELIEMFKGKGGSENENALSENPWEVADGYVSGYWGQGSRAARLLQRVGSRVRRLRVAELKDSKGNVRHAGLFAEIDVRVFRGLEYAFQNIDNKSEMTAESRARLAALGRQGAEE